jgi:hypothetical protein
MELRSVALRRLTIDSQVLTRWSHLLFLLFLLFVEFFYQIKEIVFVED